MTEHRDDVPKYLAERLEGMKEIRRAIDPTMSERTFYRQHRPHIGHILMEYRNWWKRPDRIRYFTFRRLLYAYMLERKFI